jgi:hypothetical protein
MTQVADNSQCGGRIFRGVRRCLIAADGKPVLIGQLLDYCYPRSQQHPRWHRTNVHRALPRYAVSLGRLDHRPGRPCVWAPNAELRKLIG